MSTLTVELVRRAEQVLGALRRRGLEIAVVSNWDVGLHKHLSSLGLSGYFSEVVKPGEAGVAKPNAAIFEAALSRLGVAPARVVHAGDVPVDSDRARAAGIRFLPTPLETALDGWT